MMKVLSVLKSRTSTAGLAGVIIVDSRSTGVEMSTNGKAGCMIVSTGSPLVPESYDYVYRDVKTDVCLASISGGTDIMAGFADANPILPVHRGELQCRGLGMDVRVYDDDGHDLIGEKGELVCVKPSQYHW